MQSMTDKKREFETACATAVKARNFTEAAKAASNAADCAEILASRTTGIVSAAYAKEVVSWRQLAKKLESRKNGAPAAARTDEECSLVCPTDCAPARALTRDDGWRALRIQGVLDFSLVGILAQIAGTLADRGIALFAVSTYNTDYILVRAAQLEAAVAALRGAGHEVAS